MKVSKNANIIKYSHIFILLTIYILTGCADKDTPSKMEEVEIETVDAEKASPNQIVLLPKGFENEPDINEKMTTLTEEDIMNYTENYRVFSYLESIKKAAQIYETLEHGQLYTDTDMSGFLSQKQLDELKLHASQLPDDRDNWYWGYISCWAGGSFKLYRQYFFTPPPHWGTQYWYSRYIC